MEKLMEKSFFVKILAVLCVGALLFTLPITAYAAGSAEQGSGGSAGQDNVDYDLVADGDGYYIVGASNVVVKSSSTKAVNTPADAKVILSKEITGSIAKGKMAGVELKVGGEYANKLVTVFIQHQNSNEQQVVKVAEDGWIYVEVSEFSIFTVAEGTYNASASVAGENSKLTSPKTGVDFSGVALATFGSAVVACGALSALHKKRD